MKEIQWNYWHIDQLDKRCPANKTLIPSRKRYTSLDSQTTVIVSYPCPGSSVPGRTKERDTVSVPMCGGGTAAVRRGKSMIFVPHLLSRSQHPRGEWQTATVRQWQTAAVRQWQSAAVRQWQTVAADEIYKKIGSILQ